MSAPNPLGRCVAAPLRRLAGGDYQIQDGEPLIRAALQQIIGTEPGELPWRPSFGTALRSRLHRSMDGGFRAMLGMDVQQAIARWESRVQLTKINVGGSDTTVLVQLAWTISTRLAAGLYATESSSADIEV